MKRFIVTESSNEDFLSERFNIYTTIKTNVSLPFTSDEYRCVMFDGMTVKLTKGNEFILARKY